MEQDFQFETEFIEILDTLNSMCIQLGITSKEFVEEDDSDDQ